MASKRFVVLGLGSFGAAVATRLSQNGCRVTGADTSEERVESLKDVLYEAVVADVTDRNTLEELSISSAQGVIVSLGESIEPSLLATLHAKELGARRVLVKGVTEEHGRILARLGVDRVIYPEEEIAFQLADKETWPNVLDFLPIDQDYGVVEMAVPGSLAGKTLLEADLRRRFDIWVLGVKDVLAGSLQIIPAPDLLLTEDQLLLIIGRKASLEHFRELE